MWGQLATEGAGMKECSHVSLVCSPWSALPWALALKARCPCLHVPYAAPEVQRPERAPVEMG